MAFVMLPTLNGCVYVARPELRKSFTMVIQQAAEFTEEEAFDFIAKIVDDELRAGALVVTQVLSSPERTS